MHACVTRGSSTVVFTAWLCLCRLSVVLSWSCDFKLTGHPDQPQDLSLAQISLLCSPDLGDNGTALQVGLSDSLLNRHLQGERTESVCQRPDLPALTRPE